jgi:hypothetical protein
MAGYAVTITLRGADAHIARPSQRATAARSETARDAPDQIAFGLPLAAVDQVELLGRPVGEGLRDWLASIGEAWTQMTFYLFDPQSWR